MLILSVTSIEMLLQNTTCKIRIANATKLAYDFKAKQVSLMSIKHIKKKKKDAMNNYANQFIHTSQPFLRKYFHKLFLL